ncbi:hypothetical protein BVY02_01840 [bacterium J17]|nr:hypothetical protein BVY02_01840 [bacterium J17]
METIVNVPFLDLKIQYNNLKEQIDRELVAVCEETAFVLGPRVAAFEENFAKFLETEHTVGVASGTAALELAFWALGLSDGDEVILPAHTFVATAIGAMSVGAKPMLVDADPKTFLFDFDKLEEAVTEKTKAICPVHLYGRATDMDELTAFAKKHNLSIIEDTAQAHGARWKGKRVGTFGEFGCYSFYPGKNLGAYGDGGAISTNSSELADKVRRLRNYGSPVKYQHPELGTNSRLDSMQAAILDIKLRELENWNNQRWNAAAKYCELLRDDERIVLPELPEKGTHVFHLFVVQVDAREELMKKLAEEGVSTGIHYPIPFYLQGGFTNLGYKEGDFPVAEALAPKILSLPMFPEISDAQIEHVVSSLKKHL